MSKVDVEALKKELRKRLSQADAERSLGELGIDGLMDAMSHPKAPETIAEIMELETASVQEGQPAPDFTLPWLTDSGDERAPALTLSDHFGKRPVGLIFGSYT
jgi:hypothetical protein